MDCELIEFEQGWHGNWVDLKGDETQETLDAAMSVLLERFEAVKNHLRTRSLYLSAVERLWMHRPGKSLGWKAPAKPIEVIPNA